MQRATNIHFYVADTDVDSIFSVGRIVKSGIDRVSQLLHIQIRKLFWSGVSLTLDQHQSSIWIFNGLSLLYVLVH